MQRPLSHYAIPLPGEHSPLIENGKSEFRGIDPERIDALSARLDGVMADMCELGCSGKPIRSKRLGLLAEMSRAMILHLEIFSQEIDLAL